MGEEGEDGGGVVLVRGGAGALLDLQVQRVDGKEPDCQPRG